MAFSAPWHNNNNSGPPGMPMMPDMPMMPNIPPPRMMMQPPQLNFIKPNPEEMMVIDKMSEYIVRNPPEFFNKIYENKKNDPKFFFLNQGHPHHMYFQWKLNQLKMNPVNDFFPPQPGPNMMCMPPNAFPANGPMPQQPPSFLPQDSLNMEIKHFNNFTNVDCKEFIDTLELITKDCSQANIQKGSKWVFDHCLSPIFIDYLAQLLIKYSQSKKTFKEKLHVTYLINDLLFHSENKQKPWIRERFCNHLIPLFNMIYHSVPLSKEDADSLFKIISIWENQKYFDMGFINALRTGMVSQQPMISQPPPLMNVPSPMMPQMMPQPPPQLIPPQPAPAIKKKYYELPAGLSVIGGWSESPYTPLKIAQITAPYQRNQPTAVLLKAIDDFYIGLGQQKKLLEKEKKENEDSITNNKIDPKNTTTTTSTTTTTTNSTTPASLSTPGVDSISININKDQHVPEIIFEKDGWEKGFLDFLYDDRRKQKEKEKKKNESKYRSSSYNRSSRSRSRGRSKTSRSRSRSRERRNNKSRSLSSSGSSRSRSRSSSSRSSSGSRRRGRSRNRSRNRSRSSNNSSRSSHSHDDKNKRKDHYHSKSSHSRDKSSSRSRSRSASRHSKHTSRSKSSHHRKYSYSSSSSSSSGSSSYSRSRSRSQSRSRSRRRNDDKKESKEDEDMDGFPLSMSMANNFLMGATTASAGLGLSSTKSSDVDVKSGLDENNIGFQMMKKLGWSGTGLGKEGKGIVEPIKGGEVRTQENKYVGIGVNSTPATSTSTTTFGLSDDKFEEYRKSKSYTYSRDPNGRRRREPIGCYRCGKHGHIARDCQELGW